MASNGARRHGRAIPSRLNVALVLAVLVTQAALLGAASHLPLGWAVVTGVVFSFVFLTNYALMHEASHGALHHHPRTNWALGLLTGLTFPTSATMMRVTHIVHHRCNRTDHEMFDCYYAGDRRWLKRAQWYAILTGLFYLVIPLGAFVVGFLRPLLLTRPFKQARSARALFDDFDRGTLALVRIECVVLVAVYALPFALGWLDPWRCALLFALGGINWSTRQYVTHAWSPRQVRDGAHNLHVGPLMGAILLNGQWDLAHHRFPTVSWIHLPRLGRRCRTPIPFWRQYLSLWAGPRPATEPSPAVIPHLQVVAGSLTSQRESAA